MNSLYDSIRRVVAQLTSKYNFYAPYSAKVIRQSADGTLELTPDNKKVPGQTGVPIKGPAGMKVEVHPGSRVQLEFENGDPRRPVATLFDVADAKKITLVSTVAVEVHSPHVELGEAAVLGIARLGDKVKVSIPALEIIVEKQTVVGGGGGTISPQVFNTTPKVVAGLIISASTANKTK